MKALSFEIGGKTAFFKKPDVNTYAYFTYNNIHKPALLGLLGAIIGLDGYTKLFNDNLGLKKKDLAFNDGFPSYYEKLKDLQISIIPLAKNGYFSKKIQVFNNSVGYASFEQGGNLIVREQWLENPKWQIIILDDESLEFTKLKDYLLNSKAHFIPYLGKNDHPAIIKNVKEIKLSKDIYNKDEIFINSLFVENQEISGFARGDETPFKFGEFSPVSLQKDLHFYKYEKLCFTNQELEQIPENTYSYEGKNYTFI